MAINKVVYGNDVLIDLSSDTAEASDVAQGKTFHLKSGAQATGTAESASGKMDLVSNPTAGNVLITDSNGQAQDGGTVPIFWGDDVGSFTSPINADQLEGYNASQLSQQIIRSAVLFMLPVGSVIQNTNNVNPSTYITGTTWELISSVALASENVFGNGKALGLTNGSTKYGLYNTGTSGAQAVSVNKYGIEVGSNAGAASTVTGGQINGVVTKSLAGANPENSGLIADTITVYTWERTA